LANIAQRNAANQGAERMKSAYWRTWSNWCDSMVDTDIVGLQLFLEMPAGK